MLSSLEILVDEVCFHMWASVSRPCLMYVEETGLTESALRPCISTRMLFIEDCWTLNIEMGVWEQGCWKQDVLFNRSRKYSLTVREARGIWDIVQYIIVVCVMPYISEVTNINRYKKQHGTSFLSRLFSIMDQSSILILVWRWQKTCSGVTYVSGFMVAGY